ncbi:hypothetical protein KP509_17G068000 [Ceratopteris richardii]|nr:hypothetical protein KP509_17G068000 [Ceratopteris richardii]
MVGSPLLSEPNGMGSPVFSDAFSALQKFLPSNTDDDDDAWRTDTLPAMDNFSCDDFRMYEFKVRRCMRGRSHDWTECPFAHPGEKARRRDPRRFHYSGTACPDFRKGACKRGDACEYAHGVFECWLHPARYRTQPCKDGRACRRRVCFFAHTVEQLRILPSVPTASSSVCLSVGNGVESPCKMLPTQETNPLRLSMNTNEYNVSIDESPVSPHLQKILENRSFGSLGLGFSPSLTAALQGVSGSSSPILSPPISPSTSPPTSTDGFWTARLVPTKSPLSNVSAVPGHRRHLNRLQTMPTISIPQDSSELSDTCAFEGMSFSLPASAHMQYSRGNADEILHSLQALQLQSRNAEMQRCSSTPSSPHTLKHSAVQHSSVGQCRYRSIPSTPTLSSGIWDVATSRVSEDEPALRVESGRSLRAEIYGKIGKDNGVSVCGEVPDLGWVNELVK